MICPACGGEATAWLRAPGSEPGDASSYELVRCPACGTAATGGAGPGPTAYTSGVYSADRPRLRHLVDVVLRLATRLPLRALRRAGVEPDAAVLDVGAGRGRLVAALREGGYRAEGIDPWPRGPGVAQASVGEHRAEGLDAVVLWHVLEHVADPLATLERVRGWLRPGGVVLVATPNIESLQARIAGSTWFHLDVPRHRTHLTPRGLDELFARARLEPVRTYHLVPEHNFHGMWFALLSRLGMRAGFPFHLLKRNVPAHPRDLALLLLAGPLLLLPALVLELVAAAVRRGGTVVVVGRVQAPA